MNFIKRFFCKHKHAENKISPTSPPGDIVERYLQCTNCGKIGHKYFSFSWEYLQKVSEEKRRKDENINR